MAHQDPEEQEQENDDVIGLLAGKATQLRALSTGIRDEAGRQHQVLDNIKASMGGADDMLRSSATKLKKVFSTAENRILGYVVAAGVTAFVLFYFFVRHR